MGKENIIGEVEGAIIRVCNDIKQKKGGSGADKIDSLSKLVNSYSRLIERSKAANEPEDYGDPACYEKLEKQETSRKGIIR